MRSVEVTVPGIANENFAVDSLYHRILLGLEEIPSVFGSGRKGTAALSQAKSPDVSQDTSSFRVTPTANATGSLLTTLEDSTFTCYRIFLADYACTQVHLGHQWFSSLLGTAVLVQAGHVPLGLARHMLPICDVPFSAMPLQQQAIASSCALTARRHKQWPNLPKILKQVPC